MLAQRGISKKLKNKIQFSQSKCIRFRFYSWIKWHTHLQIETIKWLPIKGRFYLINV